MEKRFAGFPNGKLSFSSVPDLFFSELLVEIDSLAELKVTLHVLWLMQRRNRKQKWVAKSELEKDALLLKGLSNCSLEPMVALEDGLNKAVARGTLLEVKGDREGQAEHWYLLNSPHGRQTLDRIRSGQLQLPADNLVFEERSMPDKPNIFVLYEQNIGPLQPILAEELDEAQQTYPPSWVADAFQLAAQRNVRNWRYIRAILERWAREGRDKSGKGEQRDRKRYITGEYEIYRRL